MPLRISGKKLAFLYIFGPCGEDSLKACLIPQSDFDELKHQSEINADPDVTLLIICFPNLFRKLRNFAKKEHPGEKMLSFKVVADYFRNNHGEDVSVREIKTIHNERIVETTDERFFINEYKLPLKVGDRVYVHKLVIVEKVETDAVPKG